jgi:PKD repeat protein
MQPIARALRFAALALIAVSATACGVDNQEPPSLIGPSGFAQSVVLSASPDLLPRDGSSQSTITVLVRNESGQGVAGQRVRVGASAGTVSQSEVVTGGDGRATFTLTAPPAGSTGNSIDVFATPAGADQANAVTRTLAIGVLGTSNATAPTPQFTVTPANPGVRDTVTFDASATTDEGAACGSACTFTFDMGDGTTKTGRIVTHSFNSAARFNVVLTVTDAAGTTATTQQAVTVTAVPAPTVTLSVAPNPPLAGQQATFTANATPAAGHTITNYSWSFGDGTSRETTQPSTVKTYTSQGVYVVTVVVTDNTGQTGSVSQQITIASSAINASISFSPTNPQLGQRVQFTALNPTAPNGATIAESGFEWNFGDPASGSNNTATGQNVEHTFGSANTFVVRLTITDSNGVRRVFTTNVTVTDPDVE